MFWPKELTTSKDASTVMSEFDMVDEDITQRKRKFDRVQSTHSDAHTDKFIFSSKKQVEKQYCALYYVRLMKLRDCILEKAKKIYPNVTVRKSLNELKQEDINICVVGTVTKNMKKKPSVLNEYSKSKANAEFSTTSSFVSDDDELFLEDEHNRIGLDKSIDIRKMVNGLVLGFIGTYIGNEGVFHVDHVVFPSFPPQRPFPSPSNENPRYVVLLSGLNMGSPKTNPVMHHMMVDYITGFMGNQVEQKFCASITSVIIAGDCISNAENDETFTSDAMNQLDILITRLCSSVDVYVMPGMSDPSNYSLPQQPLHKVLFPGASQYSTLHRITNPSTLEIENVLFQGTAGENIDDIRRSSVFENDLDLLELTLKARNIAPTAPDTLSCHPFHDQDPFLMDEAPHVMFSGNQSTFQTRTVSSDDDNQKVQLVTIPSFSKTGTILLMNLNDLAVHPISFSME